MQNHGATTHHPLPPPVTPWWLFWINMSRATPAALGFVEIEGEMPTFSPSPPLPLTSSNIISAQVSFSSYTSSKYLIALNCPSLHCHFCLVDNMSTFDSDNFCLFPLSFVCYLHLSKHIWMGVARACLLLRNCMNEGVLDCAKAPMLLHPPLMQAFDPVFRFITRPPWNMFHLPFHMP
jgi:hypothetical protein